MVEQFDSASLREFEIVDLTVEVRCGSGVNAPSPGHIFSTLLAI